jgi:hypothetical protein
LPYCDTNPISGDGQWRKELEGFILQNEYENLDFANLPVDYDYDPYYDYLRAKYGWKPGDYYYDYLWNFSDMTVEEVDKEFEGDYRGGNSDVIDGDIDVRNSNENIDSTEEFSYISMDGDILYECAIVWKGPQNSIGGPGGNAFKGTIIELSILGTVEVAWDSVYNTASLQGTKDGMIYQMNRISSIR